MFFKLLGRQKSCVIFVFCFLLGVWPLAAQDHTTPAADHEKTAQKSADGKSADDQDSADEDFKNTLKWATASEVDNFGYDIYRSDNPDGPFERLTAEPMAGAGTTDEPTYYKFSDDNIDPYQTYYYYVESISIHGERERFTPIQKVKAKLTAETADVAAEDEDKDEEQDGESTDP